MPDLFHLNFAVAQNIRNWFFNHFKALAMNNYSKLRLYWWKVSRQSYQNVEKSFVFDHNILKKIVIGVKQRLKIMCIDSVFDMKYGNMNIIIDIICQIFPSTAQHSTHSLHSKFWILGKEATSENGFQNHNWTLF